MSAQDYTRGGRIETEEGEIFLEQNPLFESLSGSNLEVIDQFAEHHCGGMFVLTRTADEERRLSVKCHETWGPGKADGEAGDIVVHLYDLDGNAATLAEAWDVMTGRWSQYGPREES